MELLVEALFGGRKLFFDVVVFKEALEVLLA